MHLQSRRTAALLTALLIAVATVPTGAAASTAGQADLVGRLVLGIAEDPGSETAVDSAFVVHGLDSQQVVLDPGTAARLAGQSVRVKGQRKGDVVVATSVQPAYQMAALGSSTEPTSETAATGTFAAATTSALYPGARNELGLHKVAIINFNFSNDRRVPFSNATVRASAFSATRSMANYFREVSNGQVTMTGSVFGWYTIAASSYGCQMTTWASQARRAAAANGVNLSGYDHIVYSFPAVSSCSWWGHAQVGGRESWLNGKGATQQVMSHELGHNLGLWHARTKRCVNSTGARVALSGRCTTSEYGDPFEGMGLSSRHFAATHLAGIGILPAEAVRVVRTTRTLTLAPAAGTTGIRLVRIPRSSAPGTYFDLEFRPNRGVFDRFGTGSSNRGVLVRLDGGILASTNLLDMTPSTTSYADAALVSGKSWKQGIDRVTIGVGAVTAAGIRVSITYGPDTSAPSAPASFAAVPSSTSVRLSWSPAWDNVAVSTYRLYRASTLIATLPGTATGHVDGNRIPSTDYRYSVRAVDAAGNVGPAATVATKTLPPDANPPSVPGWLSTSIGLDSVRLAWGTATDAEGPVAGYRLSRDGVLLANLPSATRSYLDTGLPPGSYAYSVSAVDAAGNVGPAVTRIARVIGPDVEAPTAPSELSVWIGESSASLAWRAASDNVGVAHYLVWRDGELVATLDAGARRWLDTGLLSGTYAYSVSAVDALGNVGPAADVSATIGAPDTTAPTAPLHLRVVDERRDAIRLVWDAATDAVGVAGYRIYRDGTLVATTGRTATWDRPGTGISVYWVVAVDAAGNVSAESEPLVIDGGG